MKEFITALVHSISGHVGGLHQHCWQWFTLVVLLQHRSIMESLQVSKANNQAAPFQID
jgi:hypothetical protein